MKKYLFFVRLVAVITLGSGVISILSVINSSLPDRLAVLERIFSLEFTHLARFLTLLIGFVLVISSLNIYKRKVRAFYLVITLSIFSIFFHLTKGLDYEESLVSLVLLGLLILTRKNFTVKSYTPELRAGVLRFAIAIGLALAYGITGFWLLEESHFSTNFHIQDAFFQAVRYFALIGNPNLVPQTRYAVWYLDSLSFITIIAVVYALYALFRPVIYRFHSYPQSLAHTKEIIEKHGRSALDYFKYWPDKSLFFSPREQSVIAYRVAQNVAIALADPVGPEDEIPALIKQFIEFCDNNDWHVAFHQTLTDFLPAYAQSGLRKLKIGDDAIIDLQHFDLQDKKHKSFRSTLRKLETGGITFSMHQPPLADEIMTSIKAISDEWLQLPGKRERQFTLGLYRDDYVRHTPVAVAINPDGLALGFLNLIPSYCPGESTIDLMRHRTKAPNGIMDFMFLRLIDELKKMGFSRFNMGMAPMAGFQQNEKASGEEKAIHFFFQHLHFLFNYQGLYQYKAKFATFWEPRYLVYKNIFDLAKIALALREITEIKNNMIPGIAKIG